MVKLRPALLIVLLFMLSLLAAACENVRIGDEAVRTLTPPGFTSRSGVSFYYPSDWAIEEREGLSRVANNLDALRALEPNPGDFVVEIFPPLPQSTFGGETSLANILLTMASSHNPDGSLTFGEPGATVIGGKAAARASITSPTTEGFALAMELSNDHIVLVFATGAIGTLQTNEETALDIAGSIQYTPPEPVTAPTPTP
jgi:hypothetical protein